MDSPIFDGPSKNSTFTIDPSVSAASVRNVTPVLTVRLFADAGLTNGAFYGHFASKSDLVATVVAQQLADQAARVDASRSRAATVLFFASSRAG